MKKSLAWLSMAQVASITLQIASSVVLARYLTPYELGIWAVATAAVTLLALAQQFNLSSLIVREEVLTREIASTAFTINASLAIMLSLMIIAAAYGGAWFFGDQGVGRVLLVLAVTPLFGIPAFLPGANLERSGRFRDISLITTATGLINAVLTIVLAMRGLSYMSVAYAQVVSSAGFAMMLLFAGRAHFSCRLGLSAWRRVAGFGVQMLAVAGINTISQKMSEIMLGRLLGLSALGLYNRASGLNNLLWGNIHLALGRAMLVDFSEYHRKGLSLAERYKQTVAITTAILWPAFGGLAVIAEPLIRVVYGERWLPAVTPFAFLALSSMVLVSITMTWELFTATGQLRAQTRIESIRALVSFILFVGACFISLEAAAAARVLEAVISVLLYRPHLNRMTQTRASDFWPIYVKSALLTVLAVAPAAAFMKVGDPAQPVVLLVNSVAFGVAFWIIGLFAVKHPLSAELRSLPYARLTNLFSR